MAQRITNADLEQLLTVLNRYAGANQQFVIETAYGQPRLYLYTSGRMDKEVSPRLSKGDLYQWMNAFISGIEYRG